MYQGHSEVYFYVFCIFKWYPERWNFYRFLNKSFFLQSATRGANVCKNGKQPRPEKFMLDRGKVCEPKKEFGHICNRFPIGAKSFPNIRNNICTKFPFYLLSYPPVFPTKFLGNLAACFGIYLGWVPCTNLSWFEGRQPHSKIFSQSPKNSSPMEEIGEKVSARDEAI